MAPGKHRTRRQAPAEVRALGGRAAPVKGAGASSPTHPAILQAIVRTAARLCEATNAHIYRVEATDSGSWRSAGPSPCAGSDRRSRSPGTS